MHTEKSASQALCCHSEAWRLMGEGSVPLTCSSPRPSVLFGASGAWGAGVSKVAPDSKPEKAL